MSDDEVVASYVPPRYLLVAVLLLKWSFIYLPTQEVLQSFSLLCITVAWSNIVGVFCSEVGVV